jgi:hypothetical protein
MSNLSIIATRCNTQADLYKLLEWHFGEACPYATHEIKILDDRAGDGGFIVEATIEGIPVREPWE